MSEQELNKVEYTDDKNEELSKVDDQVEEIVANNNETEGQHKEDDHDETKVFLDLFNNFDPEKTGRIKAENLYEIATMIGKESQNVDDVLKQHDKNKQDQITYDEYQQIIVELDRPNTSAIVSERSHQSQNQSQRVVITPDPKVTEFIKLLYAFQAKCETEGKYGEAKLAQQKIEDIKAKEMVRQENNIKAFQEEELIQVENAQKEQFIEFNKVWDNYMAEYEVTALDSLEKLKEKHIKEVEELHERLKGELAFHFKSSKQLIELRQKEQTLVKMKKYGEAEKIKSQADGLEEWERNNKEKEITDIIDKKTAALRKQQQRSLTVLLKRIQKDRNQQLMNREQDSQKLILKNKNLRSELLSKHSIEARNAIEVIRSNLTGLNSTQAPTQITQTKKPATTAVLRKTVV